MSYYWPLFKHMSEAHGLTLTEDELQQIANAVEKMRTIPGPADTETIWGQSHNCPSCKGLGSYVGVAGVFDKCPVCNGTGEEKP